MNPNEDDPLHYRKVEDLYDLYNACNGVMHNGLLDIRKLAELSAEETEVLDIERLRQVWEHMESCGRCQAIVKKLNSIREEMRKRADEPYRKSASPVDTDHVDPLPEQNKRGKK